MTPKTRSFPQNIFNKPMAKIKSPASQLERFNIFDLRFKFISLNSIQVLTEVVLIDNKFAHFYLNPNAIGKMKTTTSTQTI